MRSLRALLGSAVLLSACGSESAAPSAAADVPVLRELTLAKKPADAAGVVAAKQRGAAPNCVVSGRVAKLVPGHAVFTLMDSALPFCGETAKEDDCKTPWDYCCETPKARAASSMLVEFRDAQGKPRAGRLDDLRLLDAVTVAGKLEVDAHGNHVLVADGWFRDARPELPADVRWPR